MSGSMVGRQVWRCEDPDAPGNPLATFSAAANPVSDANYCKPGLNHLFTQPPSCVLPLLECLGQAVPHSARLPTCLVCSLCGGGSEHQLDSCTAPGTTPTPPTLALMSMATHEPDERLCTPLVCQHNRVSTFTASCKALMGTGQATMEDLCFSCQVRAGSATCLLCCIITDHTHCLAQVWSLPCMCLAPSLPLAKPRR